MPHTRNNLSNNGVDANNRINAIWERVALGLISFIVACLFMFYQGLSTDIKEQRATIVQLQTNKVDRADLRETEVRINTKIDAVVTEIKASSSANKADILDRIDLYFKKLK